MAAVWQGHLQEVCKPRLFASAAENAKQNALQRVNIADAKPHALRHTQHSVAEPVRVRAFSSELSQVWIRCMGWYSERASGGITMAAPLHRAAVNAQERWLNSVERVLCFLAPAMHDDASAHERRARPPQCVGPSLFRGALAELVVCLRFSV